MYRLVKIKASKDKSDKMGNSLLAVRELIINILTDSCSRRENNYVSNSYYKEQF